MICYDDPENQQRWISEVKKTLPHFSSEIEKIYENPFIYYKNLVKTTPNLKFRDIFYKTKKFEKLIDQRMI